jgi:hypothetical protein
MEVFRDIASKATLPIETYEKFLTWRAARCYTDQGFYVPHKTNRRGYFSGLAAWWQKLGLLPRGNALRFANMCRKMNALRDRRKNNPPSTDHFASENRYRPALENAVNRKVRQALRALELDTDSLWVRTVRNPRTYINIPRTKTGLPKKNESADLYVPLSWHRKVWKRGWAIMDGRLVLDWKDTKHGRKVAFLMPSEKRGEWSVGVANLDETGDSAQFSGRVACVQGMFVLKEE